MKKLLLFIFLSMVIQPLKAYNVIDLGTSAAVECDNLPSYEKTVEKAALSYTITYSFDSIAVISDKFSPDKVVPAIKGFTFNSISGEARVPQKLEYILLPKNGTYSIIPIEEDYVDAKMSIAPAISDMLSNSEEAPVIEQIAVSDAYAPTNSVSDLGVQILREQRILKLLIQPVKYNSSRQIARIYRKISFRIVIMLPDGVEPDYSPMDRSDSKRFPLFQNLVMEIKEFEGGDFEITKPTEPDIPVIKPSIPANTYKSGYLIVVTGGLVSEAMRLIEWKKKIGYDVYWFMDINGKYGNVRDRIKQACMEHKNIQYLLIIGDASMIAPIYSPMIGSLSNSIKNDVYTDMYYACLDGDDDHTADLYYGRIPAKNLEEARVAIDKIIAYESGTDKPNFSSHFVSAAYFQDYLHYNEETNKFYTYSDGYEDRDFCWTAETLALVADKKFSEVTRMYYHEPGIVPRHWSNYYADGSLIPSNLRLGYEFSSSFNHLSVINEINRGTSIFFHRDHGQVTGWEHPNMETSHLSQLENTVYPIVFSIDCLTGAFHKDNCFASTMLCQSKGGCASIIAATQSTYSGKNESFSLGMFKSLWPEANIKYSSTEYKIPLLEKLPKSVTIGEMMSVGQIQREQCYPPLYGRSGDLEAYHILGDPSLRVIWNDSINLEDIVKIEKQFLSRYKLSVGDIDDAEMSVHCEDYTYYEKGNSMIINKGVSPADIDSVYITVNARGLKPYCFYAGDWLRDHPRTQKLSDMPDVTIGRCSVSGNQIAVELEGELCDNLTLSVVPGTLTSVSEPAIKKVEDRNIVIESGDLTDRLYHISLMYNNQEIDNKTVLKQ